MGVYTQFAKKFDSVEDMEAYKEKANSGLQERIASGELEVEVIGGIDKATATI